MPFMETFLHKKFPSITKMLQKKRIDSYESIRLIFRILKECILREEVLGVRRAKNRSLLERK
jgi:hypothetical protein